MLRAHEMWGAPEWAWRGTLVCALLALTLVWIAGPARAADCSGTSAFVAISSVNYSSQQVLADGTWSVSGGADSVRLQHFIDGTLFQDGSQSGTTGSWSFIDDFAQCGDDLPFKACAAPRVCDGSGCTVCVEHETCKQKLFDSTDCSLTVSGPLCSWTCSGFEFIGAECTGSCSVTASGGEAPYSALWHINGTPAHIQSSSTGTFNLSQIDCLSGDSIRVDITDDNNGSGSGFTTCGF